MVGFGVVASGPAVATAGDCEGSYTVVAVVRDVETGE
jgi:hypothetical protein